MRHNNPGSTTVILIVDGVQVRRITIQQAPTETQIETESHMINGHI